MCAFQYGWERVWPFWSGPLNHNCQIDKCYQKESLTCNFELHSHWSCILDIDSRYPYIGQCGGTHESWKTLPSFRIMTKCQTFGLQDHHYIIIFNHYFTILIYHNNILFIYVVKYQYIYVPKRIIISLTCNTQLKPNYIITLITCN